MEKSPDWNIEFLKDDQGLRTADFSKYSQILVQVFNKRTHATLESAPRQEVLDDTLLTTLLRWIPRYRASVDIEKVQNETE